MLRTHIQRLGVVVETTAVPGRNEVCVAWERPPDRSVVRFYSTRDIDFDPEWTWELLEAHVHRKAVRGLINYKEHA